MSCDLWRGRLIELARGSLLDTERNRATLHVSGCLECRLFLEEQMALTTALTELAADSVMAPPPDLEPILLAEFDSTRRESWRRRYLRPAAAIGAIAASIACFAVLHEPPRHARLQPSLRFSETAANPPVAVMPAPKPVPRPVRRAYAAKTAEDAVPFVAIPYTVAPDPRERMTVMRVEMPVTALVAVGLTAAVPDPAASAQADVMVGEDGRIRAIRLVFLDSSAFNADRRIN